MAMIALGLAELIELGITAIESGVLAEELLAGAEAIGSVLAETTVGAGLEAIGAEVVGTIEASATAFADELGLGALADEIIGTEASAVSNELIMGTELNEADFVLTEAGPNFSIAGDEALPDYLLPEVMPNAADFNVIGDVSLESEAQINVYLENWLDSFTVEEFGLNVEAEQIAQSTGITVKDLSKIIGSAGNIGAGVKAVADLTKEVIHSLGRDKTCHKNELIVDADGNVVDPYQIGKDLGKFITLTEVDTRNGMTEAQAVQNVINNNPELQYLVDPVWEFEREDYDIQKLLDGTSKYDGNLSTDDLYHKEIDGQLCWTIKNEIGEEISYTGPEGSIKALYGEFFGPSSFNRHPTVDEPNRGRPKEGLIDLYSMLHDENFYKYGYFDYSSDLQFINRISKNLNRMSPEEQRLGKFAISYFSTIGYTISQLKRNLPSDVYKRPVEIITNDIFKAITGSNNAQARMRFYLGLKDGLQEYFPHPDITNSKSLTCKPQQSLDFRVLSLKNFG